jgi:hypothetical protein
MGFYRGPNIVTNGLVLALDAANPKSYPGTGTTWFDLSGNGRNFTWGSVSWNSSGFFNTSGRVASGPASNSFGIDNSSGYTIFTVFMTNSGSTNGLFKFFGDSVLYNRGIFVHPGWTNETLYFDQGGCCDNNQRTDVYVPGLNGSWSIAAFRSLVSQRNIFRNGSLLASNLTSAANINLNSTGVQLNPNDEGYNWDGKLAYFAVYNRGLTQDEYTQNYQALKTRFGL